MRATRLFGVLVVLGALASLAAGCRLPPPVALPWPASQRAARMRMLSPPADRPQSQPTSRRAEAGAARSEVKPTGLQAVHYQEEILAEAEAAFDARESLVTAGSTYRLTLDQAVAVALAQNPRLREAAARIDEAAAGVDIAYASFLPEMNAGFRESAFNQPVLPGGSFVPASLNGGATDYTLVEAGVYWMLCDFGRRAGEYGQAASRAQIAAVARRRVAQTVAYDAAHAYFRVLYAEAIVGVRRQSVERARAVLDDTLAFRLGGVAERESVLRAEVQLSQAREELVSAEQHLADAAATLNLALGRAATWPVEVVEVEPPADAPPTLEACLGLAASRRPEIDALRSSVAEAAYGVETARADMLPKIFVRGTVVGAESNGPVDGWITGAGLHVEQALYAGGRRRAAVRRDQARVAAATARLQTALDQISHQVTVAYQTLPANLQRIALGRAAMGQAAENLRLTIVRYQNGDATPTDVVDAETALVAAQSRFFTATYDYLDGLAQLDYAIGGDQAALVGAAEGAPGAEPILPQEALPPTVPEARRDDG